MTTTQHWDADRYDERHGYVTAHGTELLDLLAARPGERALDAGCGTGQHARLLHERGVAVVGVDASPAMVERARRHSPGVDIRHADVRTLDEDPELRGGFDAVLSNAALHWVPDATRAARSLHAVLRPGGRLVVELGGAGNIAILRAGVRALRAEHGLGEVASPWYFPTIAGYAGVLEEAGLEVRSAWLFDRPTRLDGDDGLAQWLRMFAGHLLADVADDEDFLARAQERLRPRLYRDGSWWADYRRLRVVAVRPD